ncbi:unnamed protein product [Cylicocyclus nassatus]|uniref:Uncharacterized protein n=1 Tax=Cylicocyclus nassatus TaxID=53992 RepID=A0AA36HI82_CYLNA|nr:unnamed protein product [Cylicocyclus nassatus]
MYGNKYLKHPQMVYLPAVGFKKVTWVEKIPDNFFSPKFFLEFESDAGDNDDAEAGKAEKEASTSIVQKSPKKKKLLQKMTKQVKSAIRKAARSLSRSRKK